MVLKRWWFPALVVWMILTPYAESGGEIYRYVDSEGVTHYSDVRWHKNYTKTRIPGRATHRNGSKPGGRIQDSPPVSGSVPSSPKAVGESALLSLESPSAESSESKSSRDLPDRAQGSPTDYLEYIENIARKYGLHPDLIWAVIKAESNFNPLAVSPKGAQGLMQLMPATARSYQVSNPFDPYQNIEGGGRHLRNLLSYYQGDLTLTLAAYNAGKEKVQQYKGIPPYWETRNYIQKVMSYLKGSNLLTTDSNEIKGAMPKAEEAIYRYTSPDGVTLFTDIPR